MPGLVVDKDRCTGCGQCAADCVCGIIEMKNGFPCVPAGREGACVHCGHCAAICPAGAAVLDGRKLEELPSQDGREGKLLAGLLRTRRACRQFSDEPLSREEILQATGLAGFGPTAHNARQVAFIVANGRDKVLPLLEDAIGRMERHGMYPQHVRNFRNGRDTIFRGAPCVILVHAPERILSESDCATAVAYLELALHAMGLASCWAGMFIESCRFGLPSGLAVPEGHALYGAVMAGRTRAVHHRIPYRSAPPVEWL